MKISTFLLCQKKANHQTVKEVKIRFPRIRLGKLCGWSGMSKQAYYQNISHKSKKYLGE